MWRETNRDGVGKTDVFEQVNVWSLSTNKDEKEHHQKKKKEEEADKYNNVANAKYLKTFLNAF